MTKRLTTVQQGVMDRLRAGESLCFNYASGGYQFSGGGKVKNVTFRALRDAGLIRSLGELGWVTVEKGDDDGN
ncbi:MAG: hypothetical protein KAV00_01995 [Phycisphaerae bacterium]|nr:hypothetical protein [Phycisphaerae bacterium]